MIEVRTMKKTLVVILFGVFLPCFAFAQEYKFSTTCSLQKSDSKAGIPCPASLGLQTESDTIELNNEMRLGAVDFLYQPDPDQSLENENDIMTVVVGRAKNNTQYFMSCRNFRDYKHGYMNSNLLLWISNSESNVRSQKNACYSTCKWPLTAVKK